MSADLGTITAGSITMGTGSFIKGGQTAFKTGTGFFLGYDTSYYKFSIGDVNNYLTWNGTDLTVKGDIKAGSYIATATAQLSPTAKRWGDSSSTYKVVKEIEVAKAGQIRFNAKVYLDSVTGGVIQNGAYRIKVEGVTEVEQATINYIGLGSTITHDIDIPWVDGTDATATVTVELKNGILTGPVDTNCNIEFLVWSYDEGPVSTITTN
jgi:hypothetical protein